MVDFLFVGKENNGVYRWGMLYSNICLWSCHKLKIWLKLWKMKVVTCYSTYSIRSQPIHDNFYDRLLFDIRLSGYSLWYINDVDVELIYESEHQLTNTPSHVELMWRGDPWNFTVDHMQLHSCLAPLQRRKDCEHLLLGLWWRDGWSRWWCGCGVWFDHAGKPT